MVPWPHVLDKNTVVTGPSGRELLTAWLLCDFSLCLFLIVPEKERSRLKECFSPRPTSKTVAHWDYTEKVG